MYFSDGRCLGSLLISGLRMATERRGLTSCPAQFDLWLRNLYASMSTR